MIGVRVRPVTTDGLGEALEFAGVVDARSTLEAREGGGDGGGREGQREERLGDVDHGCG